MYSSLKLILTIVLLKIVVMQPVLAEYDVANAQGIPTVTKPDISQFKLTDNSLHIEVQLPTVLPPGYGVFINFDNQQGDWFIQNTPGGHKELTNLTGSTYSLDYTLDKPGLRSVRAGIFETQNDENGENDQIIGDYSEGTTCTLSACFNNITQQVFGNPAITGSGSQLFKNVDVANGNYHLSTTDMSVPGVGPSFAFTRAYNSRPDPDSDPDYDDNVDVQGEWSFGYEMKAEFTDKDNRQITIGPREDGHYQTYFKAMDDDENASNDLWYTLTPGNFDQLVQNSDASNSDAFFTLYTKGNRLYTFAAPDETKIGQLSSIQDRLGNALTFEYDAGLLTSVKDANGRTYTITRDSNNNRVKRVTGFAVPPPAVPRYVEYSYDNNGMITAVRNMRGGLDRYSYAGTALDNRFRLKTITDPRNNLQLTINYDNKGRVDDITNGVNKQVDFSYGQSQGLQATGVLLPEVGTENHRRVYFLDDNRTRVVGMVDAKALEDNSDAINDIKTKTAYVEFDESKNLVKQIAEQALVTQITDPRTNTTDITYSDVGKGNPGKITDAIGTQTEATYEPEGNQKNLTPVKSVTQLAADITTSYASFTESGKVQLITDAKGNPTSLVYDSSSDLLDQQTDARNNTTNYRHDTNGNTDQVTDALGNITSLTFDNLGRLETETTPLSLVTSYTYDEHGNMLRKNQKHLADNIDFTTEYFYDASDNLSYSIDPKNLRTDYTYDEINRKTKESYSVNNIPHTKRYSYDAMGRLASVTNERNEISVTNYNSRSSVSSKVNPLGQTVTYGYDKNDNVVTVTVSVSDTKSRTTTTTYDKLNRKTKVTDDEGNEQNWTYNNAGQVASYINSRDQTSRYVYDKVGNLTQVTDPENGINKTEYDANGNAVKVTDAKGNFTTYTYDPLNRRKSTLLNGDANHKWQYEYDANGNQTKKTTPQGEVKTQVYDALNRVTQLTELDGSSSNNITRRISYSYDANSNITSETSSGNTISYTYDGINRVTSVTDSFGKTIAYGYDKVGNRTSLTYPGNKTISYQFDAADRLENLTDWLNDTTEYVRNDAGQVTETRLGNRTKVTYGYDTAGRLILLKNLKADGTIISSHDMTLDGAGNITESLMDLPLLPTLPPAIGTMTYDNKNRISQVGSDSYNHDQTGRSITRTNANDQYAYSFDVNDHITSITKNGVNQSSYNYDLNNNRISQTQNGIETRYVVDQLAALPNVVAETDGQGSMQRYYIYGDGLVSQIDTAGNSHYYHYDPTGHTLALSDASGDVSDTYAYSPYGFTSNTGVTQNPFRFVGKYGVMDDENGLHYMRARYYSEGTKRFLSLDALHGDITNPQALNRYAYVLGNPVMGVDPSGLCTGETGQGSCMVRNDDYSKGATPIFIYKALVSSAQVANSRVNVVKTNQIISHKVFEQTYKPRGWINGKSGTSVPFGYSSVRFVDEVIDGSKDYRTQNIRGTNIGYGLSAVGGIISAATVVEACKKDRDSCVKTTIIEMASNVTSMGAIICVPATQVGVAVCAMAIGAATDWFLSSLFRNADKAEQNMKNHFNMKERVFQQQMYYQMERAKENEMIESHNRLMNY
jgi:RHS repeat-associated protein